MSAAKHICDICGTSFSERWMLNRHLVIHNGANFQCQLCSKSFTTQGYLRKHEKTLDLPNTSQQSILISCTDASTVTKVSPERNIMKSMLKDVAAKQKKM